MERRRRNEEKLVGGENKRLIYIVVGVLITSRIKWKFCAKA